MKIVLKPKYGGKTTDLIHACAAAYGYMVVQSTERAYEVYCYAKKLGYPNFHLPITYDELIRGRFGSGASPLFIDDLEELLRELARGRVRIGGFSATIE